jgi:hypothetical protein
MCKVPRTSCIFLNKQRVFFLVHFYKQSSSWNSLCSLYFKMYVLVVYLICPTSSSYLLHLPNIVGQSVMYIQRGPKKCTHSLIANTLEQIDM